MTVDYNPSDKWLTTVMKANEKKLSDNIRERLNKKFSALKGMASSNIVQEATRQALESIDY